MSSNSLWSTPPIFSRLTATVCSTGCRLGFLPLLLPRYFVERLGFKTWDQVSSFIARQDSTPWWWMLEWDDLHAKARKKFQELVESNRFSQKSIGCSRTGH